MHIPVLLSETIEALQIKEGGTYVDCTVNRAGHSLEIAKKIGDKGVLIIIDLDTEALSQATAKLNTVSNGPKVIPIHANFRTVKDILKDVSITQVDGLIADLGLSSQELDESKRGFSFRFDEPLLMTFESDVTEDTLTAKDIVNTWSEESISDILYGYGDERYSRRIAKHIVEARSKEKIMTTFSLLKAIESAVPAAYRHGKTHFATKTFQALRIAVNDELGAVKDLIAALPHILKPTARAAIITFHSTEDRIVKQTIKETENLTLVFKKAIIPSQEEIKNNPRARSAQLRVAEKHEQ